MSFVFSVLVALVTGAASPVVLHSAQSDQSSFTKMLTAADTKYSTHALYYPHGTCVVIELPSPYLLYKKTMVTEWYFDKDGKFEEVSPSYIELSSTPSVQFIGVSARGEFIYKLADGSYRAGPRLPFYSAPTAPLNSCPSGRCPLQPQPFQFKP